MQTAAYCSTNPSALDKVGPNWTSAGDTNAAVQLPRSRHQSIAQHFGWTDDRIADEAALPNFIGKGCF